MEILRRVEHLSRPPAAFGASLSALLGEPLYSRLQEATQRRLQWAEYLYNLNLEPDGLCMPASMMARGYESEVLQRIVWPFIIKLRDAGVQSYPEGPGKQLIKSGEVQKRSMTLGDFALYLKNDEGMRKHASAEFNVEAIWRDATWVAHVRNEAVHNLAFDRALADRLRREIMRPDGILSRLHPKVGQSY